MIKAKVLEVVRQRKENSRFLVGYDVEGKSVMKDPLRPNADGIKAGDIINLSDEEARSTEPLKALSRKALERHNAKEEMLRLLDDIDTVAASTPNSLTEISGHLNVIVDYLVKIEAVIRKMSETEPE
jgi:hypothetical protein